jgi:hypothetical protein
MTRTTTPGPSVERLAASLLPGDLESPSAAELLDWLTTSARFRSFAEANQSKIRKKLRGARDDESRLDVRAELQLAHLLLGDKHIGIAFEAYGSGRTGPDFTVTYRATRTFNVEVTRPRRVPDAVGLGASIAAKLRQLPPSVPNVLVLAIDGGSAGELDVAGAARLLRARADARDDAFFAGHGLTGTRGFNERYLRLGDVITWCEGAAAGDERAARWTNPSARIAVDLRAASACVACLRSSPS